jgi:hypothetical protein
MCNKQIFFIFKCKGTKNLALNQIFILALPIVFLMLIKNENF